MIYLSDVLTVGLGHANDPNSQPRSSNFSSWVLEVDSVGIRSSGWFVSAPSNDGLLRFFSCLTFAHVGQIDQIDNDLVHDLDPNLPL